MYWNRPWRYPLLFGAASSGSPVRYAATVITSTPHGYSNGDQIFIAGTGTVLDSTPGRQYLVTDANTDSFSLTDLDGNPIQTTTSGIYNSSTGTAARVFTLTTPYSGSDVQLIKWTQSADTLTLCHPSYPPADLTRTEHWVWNSGSDLFCAHNLASGRRGICERRIGELAIQLRRDRHYQYASGRIPSIERCHWTGRPT